MKEFRSGSQILFGYLPEQTVDLRGRIWKVSEWVAPIHESIDPSSLRRELRRQAAPWATSGRDGKYVENLHRGFDVDVLSLNSAHGVRVDSFPNVYSCKRCRRIESSPLATCKCGIRNWGQLPFVGFHECGAIREPWIPTCPEHKDRRVTFPGTASAGEIRFDCPVCKRELRKGFGFPKCECGDGQLKFNVHRAASVYTPRGVVIVNPPSPEKMRQLEQAGGATRALAWVVDGCTTRWPDATGHTKASFTQQLIRTGLSAELAATLADQAEVAGELGGSGTDLSSLGSVEKEEAEAEAVTVAMAVSESRTTPADLQDATPEWSELGMLYRTRYPVAMRRSGMASVELIDKFPVLTGNFAYTRGDPSPEKSKLVPFRNSRGNYVVYADVNETEALFVRLDPVVVARWLADRGFDLPLWSDTATARLAILSSAHLPRLGSPPRADDSVGDAVFKLVHSLAHRFIRRTAVFAGIERTALAELLVPLHLGFFIYAAARGDFVLGGLQAVFESELDELLFDVISAEHRCPLDPGCHRAGGACMACLHVGEPSCRFFNSYLSRSALFGPSGFLTFSRRQPAVYPPDTLNRSSHRE